MNQIQITKYITFLLDIVYPKHRLPKGQPLQDQYYDLLDELERLLDRADTGKKNVKLAPFLAHLRAFLNHAQLNKGDTIRSLLAENGVAQNFILWVVEEKWWNLRQEDLSRWTQDQRDDLRIWLDLASIIQIVALEADPVLEYRRYSYDPAGSMTQDSFQVYGASRVNYSYHVNDNSHLAEFWQGVPAGTYNLIETYAYDHLNRRVVKQGGLTGTVVYHYDLQGNLIGESDANGEILREWVYLNGQRLAMILPAEGGGGGGCESPSAPDFPSCSSMATRTGAGAGGGAILFLLGPAFIAIGLKYHRRKYTILGLTFIGGVLLFLLMPNAQSQTPAEKIYYYHNDHLGTPRVVTDQSGAVVWDVDYTPFGEIANYVSNTLPVDQPFRFPGQYNDPMTGLYYNWNRYYMPGVGRYNRVDPFNLFAIRPNKLDCINNMLLAQSKLNLRYMLSYSYVANNPLILYDPIALGFWQDVVDAIINFILGGPGGTSPVTAPASSPETATGAIQWKCGQHNDFCLCIKSGQGVDSCNVTYPLGSPTRSNWSKCPCCLIPNCNEPCSE